MPRAVALLLLVAVVLTACAPSPTVDQAEVTGALAAVRDWLAVDDDGVTTDEAVRRADAVVESARPVVEARPPIEGLDDDQVVAFHDALAGLRDSVAEQRDVLAACDDPRPAACIGRSDLDPAELAEAVERFQDAIAPLATAPTAVSA